MSRAWNLIPNQGKNINAHVQLYLYDRTTGKNELISVGTDSQPANADVSRPNVSNDWRYFVFSSNATNLSGASINERNNGVNSQVYLYDNETKQIQLISADIQGYPANGDSDNAVISPDGRFIAFESNAKTLIPDQNIGDNKNVYLYDRSNNNYVLVTRTNDNEPIDKDASLNNISFDSKAIFFSGDVTNLDVTPQSQPWPSASAGYYKYDIASGKITRTLGSQFLSDDNWSNSHDSTVWSADSDVESNWDNQPNWAGKTEQVIYKNVITGESTVVSMGFDGKPGNGYSDNATISGDGRYVAFSSDAPNLISNDTNGYSDVFIWDRLANRLERISNGVNGSQSNGSSYSPSISNDGRYIVFTSDAKNLINLDQSEYSEIFIYDRSTGKIRRITESASCGQ
jgi:Tol biopolymer transport system component